jgi:hypothetical protein
MPAAFGTLIERLVGAQIYFAPDGSLIGTAAAAISATAKPASPTTAYLDYNLGRVNTVKHAPKTKDRTREWANSTGGYKERTTKVVVEDAMDVTLVEYPPQLFDQLMFGTAALAAVGSQQAFEKANRYKDGWLYMKRINEAGVVIGIIEIHARLSIDTPPEDKNEPGSPVIHLVHLADAGALDTITFAVG